MSGSEWVLMPGESVDLNSMDQLWDIPDIYIKRWNKFLLLAIYFVAKDR